MPGRFVISRSGAQFHFVLKASNGEVILSSERYVSNAGARNGIQSVKDNSPYDSRYSRLNAQNGQYYFVLKAANGEVIGTSETYVSTYGRDQGIESVKVNAPGADTVDIS